MRNGQWMNSQPAETHCCCYNYYYDNYDNYNNHNNFYYYCMCCPDGPVCVCDMYNDWLSVCLSNVSG